MNHYATPAFWVCYQLLPPAVQRHADKSFERLKSDPKHPALHFKKVGKLWSARVGQRHRAVAVQARDGFVWFWIGTHADYDQLVK